MRLRSKSSRSSGGEEESRSVQFVEPRSIAESVAQWRHVGWPEKINVFAVSTPLQVLGCVEATTHWHDAKNLLIVSPPLDANDQERAQLRATVARGHWDAVAFYQWNGMSLWFHHVWKATVLRYCESLLGGRVRRLFIGDVRGEWVHLLRGALRPDRTYVVDDGAATILIQDEYFSQGIAWPPEYHLSAQNGAVVSAAKRVLYGRYERFGLAASIPSLFTSFPVEPIDGSGQEVVRHTFATLRGTLSARPATPGVGVHFGSKYSECGVMTLDDERVYLRQVGDYYSRRQLRLEYVAHRAEAPEKLSWLESALGCTVVRPDTPAEMYLGTRAGVPSLVSGGYTSALVTTQAIYSPSEVVAFRIPEDAIAQPMRIRVKCVYDRYADSGIDVVFLGSGVGFDVDAKK